MPPGSEISLRVAMLSGGDRIGVFKGMIEEYVEGNYGG